MSEVDVRKLRSTDIFEDCFHIRMPDTNTRFATINGFRMGTLPTERVGWNDLAFASKHGNKTQLYFPGTQQDYSSTNYELLGTIFPVNI